MSIVSMLRSGCNFDPECARTTHRLRYAAGILKERGFVKTVKHDPSCVWSEERRRDGGRNLPGMHFCSSRCKVSWSGNPTDKDFQDAFNEADRIISEAARQAWEQPKERSEAQERSREEHRLAGRLGIKWAGRPGPDGRPWYGLHWSKYFFTEEYAPEAMRLQRLQADFAAVQGE